MWDGWLRETSAGGQINCLWMGQARMRCFESPRSCPHGHMAGQVSAGKGSDSTRPVTDRMAICYGSRELVWWRSITCECGTATESAVHCRTITTTLGVWLAGRRAPSRMLLPPPSLADHHMRYEQTASLQLSPGEDFPLTQLGGTSTVACGRGSKDRAL